MIEIFDRQRKKIAILENAFDIRERLTINAINSLSFSLPDTDSKNRYCNEFNLVKYNGGDTYRIIQITDEEREIGYKHYECEHVIALLMDTIIPGHAVVGNIGVFTRDVINYILSKQITKDWILGECDFSRQFEYGWEKENLLGALFSIPTPFVDKYIWKFNTSVYPYVVSLKRMDETRNPDHYIRKGHNRLKLTRASDLRKICTRIYPYGAGEGVNQLTIESINDGKLYLQSPQNYIDKYGIIERAWIDRRYTNIESLLESARSMLNELQEPYFEYEAGFDGECDIGDIVQIVGGIKSIIVGVDIDHSEIPQTTIRIANKPKDVAATISDLEDRQRIEMTYSQGATQIYSAGIANNADKDNQVELNFYLPSQLVFLNAVHCKIKLSPFRGYTENTSSTETTVKTSTEGGGGQTTSQHGGGSSTTSTNGGGGTTSSSLGGSTSVTEDSRAVSLEKSTGSALDIEGYPMSNTGSNLSFSSGSSGSHNHGGGSHAHSIPSGATLTSVASIVTSTDGSHYHNISGHTHGMYHYHMFSHSHTIPGHTHDIPGHSHNITINDHSHGINIPSHSHDIQLPSHSHDVTIEAHNHDIVAKITRFGYPKNFWLYVNGEKQVFVYGSEIEMDITEYLKDDKGMIRRGVWHTIGVLPDDYAYVEISYNVQGFIQSRGDVVL